MAAANRLNEFVARSAREAPAGAVIGPTERRRDMLHWMRSPFVMIVALAAGCGGSVADDSNADSGADASAPVDSALDTYFCCENPPPPDVTLETTATPTFSPEPGDYDLCSAYRITIACATPGASIYYTTDGSEPTPASAKYASAVRVGSNFPLRAMATAPGFANSAIAAGSYRYTVSGKPAPVSFTPAAGTYAAEVELKLTTPTPLATICFTRDGSPPTCDDDGNCTGGTQKYTTPLPVAPTTGGATVKAIACRGCIGKSDPTSATYRLP